MPFTLTQVLLQRGALRLYGSAVSDLQPRGDLGLGLDPDGPVGFALIRAYRHAGHGVVLPAPLLLSVYGAGQAPAADDALAGPDDRVWAVHQHDAGLLLALRPGRLIDLLRAGGATAGDATPSDATPGDG